MLQRSLLYLVVVLFAISTGVASHYWWYQDIWLNLFSEALGIVFTIFIIEHLISFAEKNRAKPARYAAFKDTLLIYGRCISLIQHMIKASIDTNRDKDILETEDLRILDPSIGDIICYLNLEDNAPVVPKRKWRQYLFQQILEIENRIDRCLQRYAAYMEPDMILALQKLERTSFVTYAKLQLQTPKVEAELGISNNPFLSWGRKGTASDFFPEIEKLGILLEGKLKEFNGMPEVPDKVEIKHLDYIKSLKEKV